MIFSSRYVICLTIILCVNSVLLTNDYDRVGPFVDAEFWKKIAEQIWIKDFISGGITSDADLILDDVYDDKMCISQLNETIGAIGRLELWAMQMIDSWGKFPAGILAGSHYSFGHYDECLAIPHDFDEKSKTPVIQTKYCLAQLYARTEGWQNKDEVFNPFKVKGMDARMVNLKNMLRNETLLTIFMGVCVPEKCSPKFMTLMLNYFVEFYKLPLAASVTEDTCSRSESKPIDNLAIFAIIFLGIVTATVILSTIYDLVCMTKQKNANSYLIVFSVYSNGSQLFQRQTTTTNRIECLVGVRVLSLLWVVLGHAYMFSVITPLSNSAHVTKWFENPHSMFILSATVSVDTFFLMSGLLLTRSMLPYLDERNGKIDLVWMYLHRYIRLTPSLAAALLICATLLRYVGSGPIWNLYMNSADLPCQKYWWSTLFYIQNYVNASDLCMLHTWYLSVDMQLYVLSPLIVYPLWRWKHKFLKIVVVLILCSMAATFITFISYNFSVRFNAHMLQAGRMELSYYTTHCRMGAWLVGVIVGFILHETRGKDVYISKTWIWIAWTLCIATLLSVLFANYPLQVNYYEEPVLESAFYESISRVVWAIAMAWLVLACIFGYGGPINWFLSLPVWRLLASLSYAIYILHLPIQLVVISQLRSSGYFSDLTAIIYFFGTLGVTLSLSVVWALAFEYPIRALERLIFASHFNNERTKSITYTETIVKKKI